MKNKNENRNIWIQMNRYELLKKREVSNTRLLQANSEVHELIITLKDEFVLRLMVATFN